MKGCEEMLVKKKAAEHVKVNEGFSFDAYLSKEVSGNFSVIRVTLSGIHEKVRNTVSERVYYVLSGTGIISVEDNEYQVSEGDLVFIKPNEVHGLTGNLEYLVFTSPPYDPDNETSV
jgi:quercetin dioxygenase-like cupin family protein